MVRCPLCQRRLRDGAPCPADGSAPPPPSEPPAPPPAPPSLPGLSVVRALGVGGFGAVWEVTRGEEPLALKVVSSPAASLSAEVEAQRLVGPPVAPAVREVGALDDGRPFLLLELVKGQSLDQLLATAPGPLPLGRFYEVASAVLRAVEAMHASGVVHRDLKPENLFLRGPRPEAVVIDYGAALLRPVGAPPSTAPLERVGTPEYISPEQLAADPGLGPASDLYAVGVLLFELLTLRLPFTGNVNDLEYAHANLRPPPPSKFVSVPPELDALVRRCLHKDPRQRPAHAREVREALKAAVASAVQNVTAPAPAVVAAPAKPSASPGRYKATVPLIFCRLGKVDRLALQRLVATLGGHLAHFSGAQCVVAFTPEQGENLGKAAVRCARGMLARGFSACAVIDLGTVTISPRPAGEPPMIASLSFTQAQRYPLPTDEEGILLSKDAQASLPDVEVEPSPRRPGYWKVSSPKEGAVEVTGIAQELPLFGRTELLAALCDEARAAFAERRPRALSVLGAPGAGKSHLGAKVAAELSRSHPSVRVLRFVAREPIGRDPDEGLREFFRALLRLPEACEVDAARGLLAERLGDTGREVFGALALLFGWLAPEDAEVKNLMAAPGALRAGLARAGGEALRRLAEERPLCVLLDDVQWFEAVALEALEQASTLELPLAVVALGRPDFRELFPRFGERASRSTQLEVPPLDRQSALALCRHLLLPATSLPESTLGRILDRVAGLPLQLVELVRSLVRDGVLRRQQGAGGWYLATEVLDALPDLPLMEWLTHRELAALRPDLAAHAQLLALLSPQLSSPELEGIIARMEPALAEQFPLEARAALHQLARRGVAVGHSNGEFSLRHGLSRSVMAVPIAKPSQVAIHRAALQYYQASELPDGVRLPRLAWHAASAGANELAAMTYLHLGESMRSRHNYVEADVYYSRSLELLDRKEESPLLKLHRGRGIARYRVARMADSLADFAEALALATRGGDKLIQGEVLLDEAMALDWSHEYHRSRELAEQAEALALADAPPLFRARLLQALGRSHCRFNQDRRGVELFRQAADGAEALGDAAYEIVVTSNVHLGFALPFLGFTEEAERRLARVEVLARERGDELHLGSMFNNRSCLWIALNERERFMSDSGELVAIARRLGNVNLELNANLNAGYFLYWRGELDEAEPFVRRTIELNHRMSRHGVRPFAELLHARLLWVRGQRAESRQLVEEIAAHQAQAAAQQKVELLLEPNDQVLLAVIELALSGGAEAAWQPVLARAHEVSQGQELIEVLELRGLAALQEEDLAAAKLAFEAALEAGARIPNVMETRLRQRLAALG